METRQQIIASTHVDSQGDKLTKEALESTLPQLNGDRKPRIGLEHIRTFPPFGVITNGQILEGKDNEYYLTAMFKYFDKSEYINLDNEKILVKEYFSKEEYPFVECGNKDFVSQITVTTDHANFSSFNEINEIYEIAKKDSGSDFKGTLMGRKSQIPDPELIVTITEQIALLLGISIGVIKTKIPEKIGEAIGDDLVKFYKMISSLVIEFFKRAKPENRPKHFVINYPNKSCDIELVITTHKPDTVLSSINKEKLSCVQTKIKQLQSLNPEKIQFIYNNEQEWEFNYLLSTDGSVIGKEKSFKERNELYNKILETQKNRK